MTAPACIAPRAEALGVNFAAPAPRSFDAPRSALPSPRFGRSVGRPRTIQHTSRPSIERLFRIIHAIATNGPGSLVNTRTLAVEWEVSSKTISRDLEFLRDRLCVPIDYDPQRFTWYVVEGAKWPAWFRPVTAPKGGVR